MTTPASREVFPALEPDYAIPPGDTLRDRLDALGMTQAELATRTGLSPKHVNQVLNGVAHLSPEVAQKLELATGIPSRLWNRLEADYRSTLTRLHQRRDLADDVSWLDRLPVRELVRREVLPAQPSDKVSRVQQLLAFFGVATPVAWSELWLSPEAAFRQSTAFEVEAGALAAWLRLGELKAQLLDCEPFDAARLRASIRELRSLSVQPPEVYGPSLRRLCAEAGVAVVFIKEIAGGRVSGATRWLTPAKALVQISGRYGTDDQIWFTFFHELGHVLLHSKRAMWIDSDTDDSEDVPEVEADRFAQDVLISPETRSAYDALPPRLADIRAFAHEIGIAPGIVVGRLQREERLPRNVGNQLKRRVQIAET